MQAADEKAKAWSLATNQSCMGAAGESLLRRSCFLWFAEILFHFLCRACRREAPAGGPASEFLVYGKARVVTSLRQELPGDSGHEPRRRQDGAVGLLAQGALAAIKIPEIGRATHSHPSRLHEGPAQPFVASGQQFCPGRSCLRCCSSRGIARRIHRAFVRKRMLSISLTTTPARIGPIPGMLRT